MRLFGRPREIIYVKYQSTEPSIGQLKESEPQQKITQHCKATTSNSNLRGCPSGSLVKNPPANVGDTGSVPDPGRSQYCGVTKLMCHSY